MLFLSLYSSPSILGCECLLGSSFSVVVMVFVILAFLVKGYSQTYHGFDDFDSSSPFLFWVDFVEEDRWNGMDSSDDENDDDYCYPCSDGYDEDDDDDDDGSDEEVGWTDEEQDDDNDDLNKRIEEFIAKVNKGWREEWLRENLHHRYMV